MFLLGMENKLSVQLPGFFAGICHQVAFQGFFDKSQISRIYLLSGEIAEGVFDQPQISAYMSPAVLAGKGQVKSSLFLSKFLNGDAFV